MRHSTFPLKFLITLLFLPASFLLAQQGRFPVFSPSIATPILSDSTDDVLVSTALSLFRHDIQSLSGHTPRIDHQTNPARQIIIVGTPKSRFIQSLMQGGKLNQDSLKGWEKLYLEVIEHPFKGIDRALVVTGSDARGTAYALLELTRRAGVSPWYWWADVPIKRKNSFDLPAKFRFTDAPLVQYRGIFLNDEAPALSNWSREKFGGFNHQFYEKVFELMLRLRSNYIWPAMWGNAFYDDDSLNIRSAKKFGIVIGTSHHEPLMRAHDEWRRYGSGKWNYDSNATTLRSFWTKGLERATNEKIVSIGMRGDGDEPMSNETATALLERIVSDQRTIIEKVTGKPARETPQLWALYKEVQDYYDKGMRVPDDVTLLLSDDNWGNIRRLPLLSAPLRQGGYGIYYHFDYVGGPRNYKWINTNNPARIWQQMNLAWSFGIRKIWIVNVGDLKPMELPISFFLDMAWNPERWPEPKLHAYYEAWAKEQFGASQSAQIAVLLQKYAQYSSRIKPELLTADTYALTPYNEWQMVLNDYRAMQRDAERIEKKLSLEFLPAYFQLVLHPIRALTNLHEMYAAVALNRWHAAQNSPLTNLFAADAQKYYVRDSLLTIQYHRISNGKWNHMMDQTHIGYTYWQQPERNIMPELLYVNAKKLVTVPQLNSAKEKYSVGSGFEEKNGYVSMEAGHFTIQINTDSFQWKRIPGIGKTGDGVSIFPVNLPESDLASAPELQYVFDCVDTGQVKVLLYFSPALNLHHNEGLRYSVSIDNEIPRIMTVGSEDSINRVWESWVASNITIKTSTHFIHRPGRHLLRFKGLSPGLVLQKLVVDFGGLPKTYLGPPETFKK